ncbi:MAG: restriction endonuclease, partial [Planctomycetota bacterium]
MQDIGSQLDAHGSQLYRYFTATSAKIGVLTDGQYYRFFSDLRQQNIMDTTPFMEINLARLREQDAIELARLSKATFDLERVIESASGMRYGREARRFLAAEFESPSDRFVRFVVDQIYDGRITSNVIERFRPIIARAAQQLVTARVDERLSKALEKNRAELAGEETTPHLEQPDSPDEDDVATTMEELEGFFIIKAIVRDVVDPSRVHARDVRSYFGILLDDNNRKPV